MIAAPSFRPARQFTGSTGAVAPGMATALLAWAPEPSEAMPAADLRTLLVLVPTRSAVRRLRTALVTAARSAGYTGVLAPKILTPAAALALSRPPGLPALPADAAGLVLARILEKNRDAFPHLFPEPAVLASRAGCESAAAMILTMRATLNDAVRFPDFAAVATLAREDADAEPDRWADLVALETRYRAALHDLGYADANDARAEAIRAPSPLAPGSRVVLAGLPDPSPAIRAWCAALNTPVTVLIAADESEEARFDDFGAPRPAAWRDGPIAWTDFSAQVHTPASPRDFQTTLAELWRERAPHGGLDAVILADETLRRPVENAILEHRGLANLAEGRPYAEHPAVLVLKEWADFLESENDWDTLARLARRPAFAAALAPKTAHTALLRAWDQADGDHLPRIADPALPGEAGLFIRTSLAAATAFRSSPPGDFADTLRRLLRDWRLLAPGDELDAKLSDLIADEAESLTTLAGKLGDLTPGRLLKLLVHRLEGFSEHAKRPAAAVALRGWLELLWEDAPGLVIAGMNDETVPESHAADAFLPGAFRQKLGLPTDADRLARDAYLLDRALRQRPAGTGRVEIFAPRHDLRGEPRNPSRLLFLGAGDELPARILRLYANEAPAAPEPAATRPWKLRPRVPADRLAKVKTELPVTALRDYLGCPFRFYLSRVLRAEPLAVGAAEPDSLAFGSLVHAALQDFGSDPACRDLISPEAVRAALLAKLDAAFTRLHGAAPSVGAAILLHAARARLGAFAEKQAERRAAGWQILACERPFSLRFTFDDAPDFVVTGKIDRIDWHPDFGYAVIDYKTSAAGDAPEDTHLAPWNDAHDRPAWQQTLAALTDRKGEPKPARWTDLQLPLYCEALSTLDLGESAPPTSGPGRPAYVLLPDDASGAAFAEWTGYTRALHADAIAATRGLIAAVRAHRFAPAKKAPRFDPYADLLGLAEVDTDAFARALENAGER